VVEVNRRIAPPANPECEGDMRRALLIVVFVLLAPSAAAAAPPRVSLTIQVRDGNRTANATLRCTGSRGRHGGYLTGRAEPLCRAARKLAGLLAGRATKKRCGPAVASPVTARVRGRIGRRRVDRTFSRRTRCDRAAYDRVSALFAGAFPPLAPTPGAPSGQPGMPVVPGSGPAGGAEPTFRTVDTGVSGLELNIGVTSHGAIFVGGWDRIGRSTDGGATWSKLSLGLDDAPSDRVLIVDKATDRVMVDDTTLGCTTLFTSDDLGASFLPNPSACGKGGLWDHQKIAVGARTTLPSLPGGYPNAVYVCANSLAETVCGVSDDGGLSFAPVTPHGASTACAFQGVPVADAAGLLYEPSALPACPPEIRVTADNGLTWTARRVSGVKAVSDAPDLAVTPDGSVYFFYVDEHWQPFFTRSPDGGMTWGQPVPVAVPGLRSALFPVVVAGANGRLAVAFYGTTDMADGWNLNPGDAPASIRWHGYVGVITGADGSTPAAAAQRVTADPLQYGCLSKLGANCITTVTTSAEQFNIADYMDIDAGPDGRAYAIFMDGCPPGCSSAEQSNFNAAVAAVQTGGPDLVP
jgi:hypothetical protein